MVDVRGLGGQMLALNPARGLGRSEARQRRELVDGDRAPVIRILNQLEIIRYHCGYSSRKE